MELTAEQESNGGHGSEVVVTCEHLGGDDDGVFQVEFVRVGIKVRKWIITKSWQCVG